MPRRKRLPRPGMAVRFPEKAELAVESGGERRIEIGGEFGEEQKDARALFGCVEEILGGIWHAYFLACVGRVTASGRRFATLSIEALNGGGARKYSVALVTDYVDEQPGNGIGIARRSTGHGLTGDTATIASFPGWASEVPAERFSVFVEELRVGGLQSPSELRDTLLADVDLIAFGVDLEKQLFVGGRLELLGELLCGGRERKNCNRRVDQHRERECAKQLGHE
jgi:hypothetical protein